ncbi:MAG: T9SS type A sorting domain-containing protein [Flavobacteriales bacterium]
MRRTLRSFFLPLFITTATLSAQQWQWAQPGAGAANADGQAIAVDAQGNSVVVGTYTSTIGFGGELLSTPDEDGIFMAKFDPDGGLLWAHILANGPGITVHGITIDDGGAIAVVGMYQGTVAFIPGQQGTTLTSAGSFDVFVAKYDSGGSPIWAHSIGGPGYDYGASICHDGYFNFFVTGDLHQTSFNLSSSKVFVTKFAYNGTEFWTNTSANYGVAHLGDGICANDVGELCITGEFFNSISWGGITLEAGTPEATIYVAKLNSDGEPIWAQKAGAGGYAIGESVDMDAQGNAYVTGFYRGTIAMGGLVLPGPGDLSYDVFVAKCASTDGTFQWATRGEGPGSDRAVGIRVDAEGNSYINGAYADTWTFGSTTLETHGGVDGYVAKVSPNGDALWARGYGGPTGESIGGMALHGTDVFVTGGFQVSMLFDPGPTLTGQPVVRDVFVAQLADEANGIGEIERPHCTLYPDPARDHVQARGFTGRCTYTVLNEQGRSVLSGGTSAEQPIDISALPNGSYVLSLRTVDGSTVQRLKFVKH